MRVLMAGLAVASVLMIGTVAGASESEEQPEVGSEAFGVYYGDGLRHLAEGREGAAAEALFRAYGIEPSARVMGLIVEAYDKMGRCGAATRQLEFLNRRHGDEQTVELDECSSTGELAVDCGEVEEAVIVNGEFEVGCGETAEVPANRPQQLVWKKTGVQKQLEIEVGTRSSLEFETDGLEADVGRLPGLSGEVPRLPFELDDGPEVPRLTLPADFDERAYRIFETADGLYRVWTVDRAAESSESEAEVEIICPSDAPDGGSGTECIWLPQQGEK